MASAISRPLESVGIVRVPKFYLPELDGLRYLAFLAVFLSHATSTPLVPSGSPVLTLVSGIGRYGVDLFFTMSAYLLTTLMLRERDVQGRVSLKAFYLRRILRIWPLYFTFLAGLLCYQAISPRAFRPEWVVAYALFIVNFVSTGRYPGLEIDPLWSLMVEEQFYLFWPLIFRQLSNRGVLLAGFAIWLLTVTLRVLWLVTGVAPQRMWASGFARLDSIAVGIIIASALYGSTGVRLSRLARMALGICGMAAWTVTAITCNLFLDSPGPLLGPAIGYVLVALGSGAFLLATLGFQGWIARYPLVYFGRISYGLYVLHLATLLAIRSALPGINPLPFALLSLVITTILAAASYRWLEKPFLKMKRRFEYVRTGG